MADNQFIVRKGIISLDDSQITGSLSVTNSVTASFFTGSYRGDGSQLTGIEGFPFTGSARITGSLAVTGSVIATEFIGDGSQLTGIDGFPFTGSAAISGSLVVNGNVTATSFTGSLQGTATTASYVALNNIDGFAAYSASVSASISSVLDATTPITATINNTNSPFTITSQSIVVIDSTNGDVTVNLPNLNTIVGTPDQKPILLYKNDYSQNVIYVQPSGSQLVNGTTQDIIVSIQIAIAYNPTSAGWVTEGTSYQSLAELEMFFVPRTETGSFATTGSNQFSGSQAITGSLTVTGGIVGTTSTASYVEYTNVANKPALVSGSSQISFNGITDKPTLVSGSSQITYSGLTGIPADIVSSSAQVAGYGIFATTGSNTFQNNQTITGSLFISQNLVVAGSSSIQYISSSIVDIADNIITVNAFNPGTRFGGLAVADSGSSPRVSGSLLFDSIKDQWLFIHETPSALTSSIVLMGPETYNDLGNETYLSANRLPKGSGIEHLRDSNITDTGTVVSINSNTGVTGSLTVSGATTIGSTPILYGNVAIKSNSSTSYYGLNVVANSNNNFIALNHTGTAGVIETEFSTGGGHTPLQFVTGGTTRLTIASTGASTFSSSVTAPFLRITDSAGQIGEISSTNANGGYITWGTSGTTIADLGTTQQIFGSGGNDTFGINGRGTRALALGTNNTERLRITAGGNVLIGTTSDPGNKLYVLGSIKATTGFSFPAFSGGQEWQIGSDSVVGSGLYLYNSGVGYSMRLTPAGAATFLSSITSGGWISAPNNFGLEVRNAANTAGRTVIKLNTSNQIEIGRDTDISAIILGTTTEQMRITSGGNVGIGTTSPNKKLEVITGNGTTDGIRLTYAQGITVEGMDITYLNTGNTTTSFDSLYNSNSAVMQFRMKTAVSPVTAMTILGSGNVGLNNGSPSGRLHVTSTGISASAPSLGWPVYNAENDANARNIYIDTEGNGSVGTAGYGATVVVNLGQYFDSRVVITPSGNGGASPGDQGSGRGKDLMLKAGTSDNGAGFKGGRLYLNGGMGYQSAYNANGGDILMQVLTGSGNVGIGTSSPTTYSLNGRHLEVNDAGGGYSFIHSNTTTVKSFLATNESALLTALFTFSAHPLTFGTNNTERMRITSGGNVGIGTTNPTRRLQVTSAASEYVFVSDNTRNTSGDLNTLLTLGNNANNTSSYFLVCAVSAGDRMYIYGNGNIVNTNGSYGTLSDISLKENIVDATPKLADLLQLKVRNFNLIGSEEKQIGFVAQEFEEIFPKMVDIDGKSGMKTIKTSVLVPMLVKAIQEQQSQIEILKAEIQTLKQ